MQPVEVFRRDGFDGAPGAVGLHASDVEWGRGAHGQGLGLRLRFSFYRGWVLSLIEHLRGGGKSRDLVVFSTPYRGSFLLRAWPVIVARRTKKARRAKIKNNPSEKMRI